MYHRFHVQTTLFYIHLAYIMKEYKELISITDFILKTYPAIPHLFKCEIFHLRPGGSSFESTAQIVSVGNCAVSPECLMSKFDPRG